MDSGSEENFSNLSEEFSKPPEKPPTKQTTPRQQKKQFEKTISSCMKNVSDYIINKTEETPDVDENFAKLILTYLKIAPDDETRKRIRRKITQIFLDENIA